MVLADKRVGFIYSEELADLHLIGKAGSDVRKPSKLHDVTFKYSVFCDFCLLVFFNRRKRNENTSKKYSFSVLQLHNFCIVNMVS